MVMFLSNSKNFAATLPSVAVSECSVSCSAECVRCISMV